MKQLFSIVDSLKEKIKRNDKAVIIYSLLFVLLLALMPKTAHYWDFTCWTEWTKLIFKDGLSNIYKSWTNYLPLYHYFLFLFGKIQGSIEHIEIYMYLLKTFTLIFDFLGIFCVYEILKEKSKDNTAALFTSLYLLLNVAYLYNSMIWGQVDSIMTTFAFFAFYSAVKKKILWTIIFSILSVNMKLQAIIFLPFLFLIIIPVVIKEFSFKKIILWVSVPLLIQLLIVLPFLLEGDIDKLWSVIIHSMGQYPVVSMNACNIWHWFVHENHTEVRDNITFLGITYNKWGLIMFTSAYFISLFPLLKNTFNKVFKNKQEELSFEKLLIMGALIPIIFFFFNTQMHERYCHPALIFVGTYALLSGRYFAYILFSIAYMLNMEHVLQNYKMEYGTMIYNTAFNALLFLITIVSLVLDLYDIRIFKSKKIKILTD